MAKATHGQALLGLRGAQAHGLTLTEAVARAALRCLFNSAAFTHPALLAAGLEAAVPPAGATAARAIVRTLAKAPAASTFIAPIAASIGGVGPSRDDARRRADPSALYSRATSGFRLPPLTVARQLSRHPRYADARLEHDPKARGNAFLRAFIANALQVERYRPCVPGRRSGTYL